MTNKEFWNRYLRAYDVLNTVGAYSSSLEQLVRRLAVRPGHAVLDAGCGTGNLLRRLHAEGADVVGLDFSDVALGILREKLPAARTVRASLEAPLPFADGSFDRVVCASVLFAISEEGARRALGELRRVLKPGGRLVITVMKPGQSKIAMLGRHLMARRRAQPLAAFFGEMHRTLGPLLRVLYYNYRMYGLSRQGGYRRFTCQGLLSDLADAGFGESRYDSTYGNSFHLVEACAPAGPAANAPRGWVIMSRPPPSSTVGCLLPENRPRVKCPARPVF
jgi:ubiquinone/menaquinone biosynthesis C-methylase UbiE